MAGLVHVVCPVCQSTAWWLPHLPRPWRCTRDGAELVELRPGWRGDGEADEPVTVGVSDG
jgi:hypothetical protein